MSKYLLYSEIKGWYWHKNWNVPTIWIKLIVRKNFQNLLYIINFRKKTIFM